MSRELRSILVAIVAATGCGGDDVALEPISIGVVTPNTGDLVANGRNQQEALLLAVEEINRDGGVLGRPLALEVRDDGSTAAGAVAAYAGLVADVPVVLGPNHSAGVVALAAEIRAAGTLTISGSATSPAITALDDGGYFFRTVPSDTVQTIVMADRIVDAGRHNVCLVYRNDAYGAGVAGALRARLAGRGVELVDAGYDPTGPSLEGVMDACDPVLAVPDPGVVFVTFAGDGRLILDSAAAHGWSTASQRIFIVGNRQQPMFDALSHIDAFEHAICTAASGPDPQSTAGLRRQRFLDRFHARFDHPPTTYAESHYDSAYLAAVAIEIAGSTDDRRAIRDALGLTSAGPVVGAGDWAGLRAAIAQHGQVDYTGASGEVNIDLDYGELLPPYYVRLWTLEDGQIVDQDVVTVTAQ